MTTNTAATQDESHLDTGRTASVALHFVTLRKQEICQNFIIIKSAYMNLIISEVFSDLFFAYFYSPTQRPDFACKKGCPNDPIVAMFVSSFKVQWLYNTDVFKY